MGMSELKSNLQNISKRIQQEIQVYRFLLSDSGTPLVAKLLLGAAIGYLLLPFDLIPDAIPVLGQLDDLLIVPGLIWIALKLIPPEMIERAQQHVQAVESVRTVVRLEGTGEQN